MFRHHMLTQLGLALILKLLHKLPVYCQSTTDHRSAFHDGWYLDLDHLEGRSLHYNLYAGCTDCNATHYG